MKILCLCGMGLGSSLIAKMNIDEILKEMNLRATVETCDVGSIRSEKADLYVTTRELAANIPAENAAKTVILTNFVKKDEIRKAMEPVLRQYIK
ncbi:MAG: maltose transporter subunit [Firmicutes bacterium]|nr:maltose transporter subunit [Bacillota bacterium]HWR29561.1 PTS sugar transporter subunit IIB [Negativicutes bacterium]